MRHLRHFTPVDAGSRRLSDIDKTTCLSTSPRSVHAGFTPTFGTEYQNNLNIYNKFVREIIFPHFKKDILYQRFPTFRVQVPNNISVAEFHKDKTHSHSPHEVIIFLPIIIPPVGKSGPGMCFIKSLTLISLF